jgi:hypothetical protein
MMNHAVKLLSQFGGEHQTAFGVDATGVFSEQVEHGCISVNQKYAQSPTFSHSLTLSPTLWIKFGHWSGKSPGMARGSECGRKWRKYAIHTLSTADVNNAT